MLRYALVVVALGGCLYDEKTFSPPFGCLDDPEPTTNKQSARISGEVADANTSSPLPNTTLTLVSDMFFQIAEPEQSGADAGYQLDLPLGNVAFPRMYVKAEAADHVRTYISNTRPVVDDLVVETRLVSTMDAVGVAMATVGPVGFMPGTGAIFINVNDCNDVPVIGATLTTNPPSRVFYFNNKIPSNMPTSTTPGGVTMIADLPPGLVTATVTAGDVVYRSQTYRVEADAFTQTNITP